MAKDCTSCGNYTSKEYLDAHLARVCGETYSGLCRLKSDPSRGAFIVNVRCHGNCHAWEPEDVLLAA